MSQLITLDAFYKIQDIANIARFRYGWYGDDGNVIFEVVGSAEQLRQQLQKYKDKLVGHDRRSLALIINLGGSHWVTLVVTFHNQRNLSAYYIDSLGNNAPSEVSQVVMEEVNNIYSLHARQQEDSFNCGIFALENIRMMIEEIHSDDEQVFQVRDYRPSREKLQEIREDFMIILRYYLGYGQSQEGNSESIIDRYKKAIEYAEEEDMEEVKNINEERILNGLRELLNIPIPPDRANLLGKLGLYHNSGFDGFSYEEREALRGLFSDIDLYKKLSIMSKDRNWSINENSRRLYKDLLNIIRNNQDHDEINQEIEEFLDRNEIDITSRDPEQGISFLDLAIMEGKADYAISLINYYLYEGIDISTATIKGDWTPLHFASYGGQSSITRSFFIKILNPIERYINGGLTLVEESILVKLINSEHEIVREINYSMDRIAKELIAKGADPNKPTLGSVGNHDELFPYESPPDEPIVDEVLPEYVKYFNPETPFSFAVLHRRIPVLLDMIDKMGLERLAFSREYTPLHYIARSIGINDEGKTNEEKRQECDLAEILARAMGDISKKDYVGNTPLHKAVINRNRYIVKLFLKRDYLFPQMKVLSIQNLKGRTAIYEAAARNEHEILELLVRVATQKDLDIRDEVGRTAIGLIEEAVQELGTSPERERTLSILKQSDYQSWKTRELNSKSSFPSSPDVLQDYGNIHAHLNEARRSYQEGLSLYNRGEYLRAMIPLERSIEHYETDRLNSPDEKVELGHAYWLLGLVYMGSSRLEQAKLNIEESIELYKSAEGYDFLEHPYRQLARIHLDLGDIGEGYMKNHIQTIEDSNARSIDKLCSHLALAGIYSAITRQLESSLGLNPEHVKWKQSFHYSEAYKLTQGDLDNSAHVVLQREMGIAYNENIGTYNIQQCVAVVAHDTQTDKVVLSHFDRYSGPLKFIEQILEQFPPQNKIDIYVYGGRDRATLDESGRYLVSDNNINQVLKQIYHDLARVNVISIDVARSLPPGVVYVVEERKLVHATPNHPDKSISSRAAKINLSLWPKKTGGYLYPIHGVDFSKDGEKRVELFNDEQKRQLQEIEGWQKQRLDSEGSARSLMWSSSQILHPIDDTLQQGVLSVSVKVQQAVLNNIDRVARNPNTRPISDHQLVLAQTSRQNPGVEDLIDYSRKELQPSNSDDMEIDAPLSNSEDIEMLDLDGCLELGNRKKRSTKGSCIDSRSDEMIMKIKLKELESKINDEVLSRHEEIENVAAYNVNKSDMLSNALQSLKLSKMLLLMSQKSEVSIELQKKAYYNALIDIGALIHDHKNHVHGDHLSALESRIHGNQLFSVAHDLYYLSKSEGNVNQDKLYSDQVKSKISSYVKGKNRLDDIYSELNIIDIKGCFSDNDIKDFYIEASAYVKEVITIHSTQVSVDEVKVCVKVKDNNGNHQKLVIGDIASIQNIENYVLDEETSEIKLRIDDDKEYTTTQELEEEHVKHYLNIPGGYKVKVGNIISSFTGKIKKEINSKLHRLELLASKKDVEEISDAEITDQDYNNVIGEIRQSLLQKGVSESTFDQFKKQLDYVNEEVFEKYVNDISKELTKNNIEFDGSKFNSAKSKGAKVSKLFSVMAAYDLLDSVKDLKTLGHDRDFLKIVFGINGILDAMDDVRSSISISRNSGVGRLISKIPRGMRKAFVKVISNPIVEGMTFATVAYQFGHNIDAIVKGDHHPLNYYFATSGGIKLTSMSMKTISMGVRAAVKGLGVTTKALKVVLAISKVLGKLSMATAVIDSAVTIGITTYETIEYVKAIASEIPLSDIEQAALSTDRIAREFSLLYLVTQVIAEKKPLGRHYEDAIVAKGYLDHITKAAKEMLMKKPEQVARPGQCSTSIRRDYEDSNKGIAAVVQYVNSIEEKYSEVIKFERETLCKGGIMGCEIEEICKFEKKIW